MMKSFSLICLLASTAVSSAFADSPAVKLLWAPINRTATYKLLESEYELGQILGGQTVYPRLETIVAPVNPYKNPNPFAIADHDFAVGNNLPSPGLERGPVPKVKEADALWFDDLVRKGDLPDVFLVGGHHVISEGWHDDPESMFLFMPTLMETLRTHPAAKQVFDHMKFAVLWGCNTMTNLEPRADDGAFLDSAEIKAAYESGDEGKNRMIGLRADGSVKTNSMEFYKSRLAREYGPNSGHYEYTRSAKAERCKGPGKYENCEITNLERIFPDSFLYDGEHRMNEPYRMKQIFPKAYLVLGFSSASPSEERRATILGKTLDNARDSLNKGKFPNDAGYIKNILYVLTADETPAELRKTVIQEIRKQWTIATTIMNPSPANGKARPSGSVTPAFPELDANGIFPIGGKELQAELKRRGATKLDFDPTDAPTFAPYEKRIALP